MTTESRATYTGPALKTDIPGPKSRDVHLRRTATVARGASWVLPVYIDRAEGPWLIDVDGNRLLDMGSGIGVTTLGHSIELVITAATEQLKRVSHTLFTVTPYEGYVQLAERLAAKTPGQHAKKSVFVNSGAEAIETAVKISRKHTGRRGVASLNYGFHGRTNLALALNYKAAPYASGFGPLASDIYRAPNSYPFRDGLTGHEAAQRTINYLEHQVGVEDLAALVVEPIQGEGGFVVPAQGYLPALQEWARANGVVFIADEIQTGIGRTGAWFACEHFDLVPDLVVTAKGLAGGLPLAGVTGRAEIMDAAQPGGLGGTFAGNPVAVAAALAVFDLLEDGSYFRDAARIGLRMTAGLGLLAAKHRAVVDVRGCGAMIAIELNDPETGAPSADIADAVIAGAAREGVLMLTAGADGNVIRFLPTLAVTDDLIDFTLALLDRALERVGAPPPAMSPYLGRRLESVK